MRTSIHFNQTVLATAAFLGFCLGLGGLTKVAAQQDSVVDSPHNLSVSGPGAVRAVSEQQVCIFCHTPHNAAPVQPLWNRYLPTEAYQVYSSTSLDAEPGQPTGDSKMCLSCHDGTIALGSVVSRDTPIAMSGGVTTMPEGHANLGTDLRDDHPISFRFDSSLAGRDLNLKHPSALPPEVQLDENAELQCTSCHDPHNNLHGDFLVLSNENSTLCRACHQIDDTMINGHQDCRACHQSHTAPSGPQLLRATNVTETCLTCHDGTHPGAKNIASDMDKLWVHDTDREVDPPDPIPNESTCTDCHDPHTMHPGRGQAPEIHPNFGEISGVSLAGSDLAEASFEFEVCFKCHADVAAVEPAVSRQIVQNNTRLEFDYSAVSYHPVAAQGQNLDVPSLRPPYTTSSIIYCSDCHGSEHPGGGGGGGGSGSPRGVHGSNNEHLLVANYETRDFTNESSYAYALCYQCHDRSSVLGDESFSEHRMHIVEEQTSCAACHDAHGIASGQGNSLNHSHLINFDTSVVFPEALSGRIEFVDEGRFTGNCTLSCHGVNHSEFRYPE